MATVAEDVVKLSRSGLLPEAAAFLSGSPLPGVIGGRDAPAMDGATFTTLDPGTGKPIAEVAAMKAADACSIPTPDSNESTAYGGGGGKCE